MSAIALPVSPEARITNLLRRLKEADAALSKVEESAADHLQLVSLAKVEREQALAELLAEVGR